LLDKIDRRTFFMVHYCEWEREHFFKSFARPGESRKSFDVRVYALGLKKLNEV